MPVAGAATRAVGGGAAAPRSTGAGCPHCGQKAALGSSCWPQRLQNIGRLRCRCAVQPTIRFAPPGCSRICEAYTIRRATARRAGALPHARRSACGVCLRLACGRARRGRVRERRPRQIAPDAQRIAGAAPFARRTKRARKGREIPQDGPTPASEAARPPATRRLGWGGLGSPAQPPRKRDARRTPGSPTRSGARWGGQPRWGPRQAMPNWARSQ